MRTKKATQNTEPIGDAISLELVQFYSNQLAGIQSKTAPPEVQKEPHKSIAFKVGNIPALEKERRVKTFQEQIEKYGGDWKKISAQIFKNDPADEARPTTWADMENMIGPISWLWPGLLPNGFANLLVGESGMCKSQVALHIAKCCTTGENWPDGTTFTGEPGAVLWLETESAQALNLSRAKAWDIPLDKFYTPFADPMMSVELDNKEHQAEIERLSLLPEVKLIVVDSFRGAQRKDENSSEAAQAVFWLASVATKINKPILLLHHLNKPPKDETGRININRVRGSSAIVQPARVIWAVDKPDPQSERRRLYVIKNNLCKFAPPIGIEIKEKGLLFGDSPHEPRKLTNVDRAREFLQAFLNEKPMKTQEIFERGKELGFSEKTIRAAAEKAQVIYIRKGFGSGIECSWSLPSDR